MTKSVKERKMYYCSIEITAPRYSEMVPMFFCDRSVAFMHWGYDAISIYRYLKAQHQKG